MFRPHRTPAGPGTGSSPQSRGGRGARGPRGPPPLTLAEPRACRGGLCRPPSGGVALTFSATRPPSSAVAPRAFCPPRPSRPPAPRRPGVWGLARGAAVVLGAPCWLFRAWPRGRRQRASRRFLPWTRVALCRRRCWSPKGGVVPPGAGGSGLLFRVGRRVSVWGPCRARPPCHQEATPCDGQRAARPLRRPRGPPPAVREVDVGPGVSTAPGGPCARDGPGPGPAPPPRETRGAARPLRSPVCRPWRALGWPAPRGLPSPLRARLTSPTGTPRWLSPAAATRHSSLCVTVRDLAAWRPSPLGLWCGGQPRLDRGDVPPAQGVVGPRLPARGPRARLPASSKLEGQWGHLA